MEITVQYRYNGTVNTKEIPVKSPDGKFAIIDVRIDDSSFRRKKEYLNIFPDKQYNISDIKYIAYDKDKDAIVVCFKQILEEGYSAIKFTKQYEKIHLGLYRINQMVNSFNSDFNKYCYSLEYLYNAFSALADLEGDKALVMLNGNAYQASSIDNWYGESERSNFIPLTDEILIM